MSCILIGDIIKSQTLENLPEVVARLKKTLGEINRNYRGEILGPFVIFGGDSFEGALNSPLHAYDIYRRISAALPPVRVRCVASVGRIADFAGGNVLEMTGPIFTRATDVLAEISKRRQRPRIHFHLASTKPERDATINILAALVDAITRTWTGRTYALSALSDSSIEEMSRRLGITRQAILKQFTTRSIMEVRAAQDEIRRQLGKMA